MFSQVTSTVSVLLGNIHPAVVHFPIALLLVVVLLESVRLIRKETRSTIHPQTPLLLCLGAFAALGAAACGWLDAQNKQFQGDLSEVLEWHRWFGTAVAALACVSYLLLARLVLRKSAPRSGIVLWRTLLMLTAVGIGVTGHLGGVLVHGAGYLWEGLVKEPEEPKASLNFGATKFDFARDIKPIFDDRCGQCHAQGKAKGGFRLDSREAFLSGGKNGKAVDLHDPNNSLLLKLISGEDPKKVMPNRGPRLSAEQIESIRKWIEQGAPWDKKLTVANTRRATLALKEPSFQLDETRNVIDQIVDRYLEQDKAPALSRTDDATFARRAYYDLIGIPPSTSQLRAFVGSLAPDKRQRLVRTLLGRDERYATHWLSFWNDLLRNDYTGTGYSDGYRSDITAWLYTALKTNKPYDIFAQELIGAAQGAEGFTKGILWRGVVNPNEVPAMQAAQNVAQVFMGINLKCASCHDSFRDGWKLTDAYALANVFSGEPLQVHRCDVPQNHIPRPALLYRDLGEIPPGLDLKSRMVAAARALTGPANGLFSKNIVNRMWAHFFGRGIVSALDDMADDAWSEDLLNGLARQFAEHDYDLKWLMETIATSKAYQLNAVEPVGPSEEYHFRGPLLRRLSAEQFYDTLLSIAPISPSVQFGDPERFFAIAAPEPSRELGAAQLLASLTFNPAEPDKQVDIPLRGARTFWLVTRDPDVDWRDALRVARHQTRSRIVISDGQVSSGKMREALATLPVIYSGKKRLKPVARKAPKIVQPLKLHSRSVYAIELPSSQGMQNFRARIKFDAPPNSSPARLEIYADVQIPASFHARSSLSEALGRPNRTIPVSDRSNSLATLDAMEFINGDEVSALLRSLADRLTQGGRTPSRTVVRSLFQSVLNRLPSRNEETLTREFLGTQYTPEAVADVIWGMLLTPEFQVIQ